MSSRLFQNVREKRGLAYAVFSGLSAYRDAGSMTIYAGCANDAVGELIDVVIAELRRMKDEPMPESELRRAKDHLKGSLMLNLESTSSRMSHLARQEIYFDRQFGLDETLEGVERVTHDDVQRVARDLFSDGRWRPRCSAPSTAWRFRGEVTVTAVTRSDGSRSMIAAVHASRNGSHLERPAEVRNLAAGRNRRGRGDGARRDRAGRCRARHPRDAARFDIARIEEIEQVTQHDVIAFTTAVAEHVGPSARWLHFGLTSSDVIDTAQALQMREACDLILKGLDGSDAGGPRARRGASAHADDRPHARRACRADDVRSQARALVRGADARRRRALRRAREVDRRSASCRVRSARSRICRRRSRRDVCRTLGLEPAPVASQVIQRDRHAELLSAIAITGVVAREVRARDPRAAEDRDRRGRGAVRQGAEGLVGDAAQAEPDRLRADRRAGAAAARAMPGAASRTTRSGTSATSRTRRSSASSCPTASSCSITCCGGSRGSSPGMVVYPERMRENLERSRGVVFSGTVLLELARRGVSREQAYEWVQRNAMRSFHEQRDFKALLLADADVTPCCRRRRSSARSISTSSCGTSTTSSTGCSVSSPRGRHV